MSILYRCNPKDHTSIFNSAIYHYIVKNGETESQLQVINNTDWNCVVERTYTHKIATISYTESHLVFVVCLCNGDVHVIKTTEQQDAYSCNICPVVFSDKIPDNLAFNWCKTFLLIWTSNRVFLSEFGDTFGVCHLTDNEFKILLCTSHGEGKIAAIYEETHKTNEIQSGDTHGTWVIRCVDGKCVKAGKLHTAPQRYMQIFHDIDGMFVPDQHQLRIIEDNEFISQPYEIKLRPGTEQSKHNLELLHEHMKNRGK